MSKKTECEGCPTLVDPETAAQIQDPSGWVDGYLCDDCFLSAERSQ